MNPLLNIKPEVAAALNSGKPVVALESTIIAHGMPWPENAATALKVENTVREHGAEPATIALLDGKICIGLNEQQVEGLKSLHPLGRLGEEQEIADIVTFISSDKAQLGHDG